MEGRFRGWERMKRQVYINTRGGLTQDPRTLRQLEKQSMQDTGPGSGAGMQLQSECLADKTNRAGMISENNECGQEQNGQMV